MATESEQAPESRRSDQGRSDAAVRIPPLHTHNHTLPAGLSRRSWLTRLFHARVLRNQWGAWCLLVAGLTVTVLASLYIKAGVESAAQREFDFASNEIRLNINARLEAAAQILRGGAALFDVSETVSRGGWRTFTQRLLIEQHLPGIQGIGFAALIPRAQLDQHVQAIRSEGFPDYQVWPAGERESYSAIVYLEPFSDRNLRAFGYDMLHEPVRGAAMERARDENAAALSGKVLLVQETGQDVQAGGLMYVPVYRHGLPIETIEQRRAALQGWVYSPYRMTDLMRGTLGYWDVKQKGKDIALQVYDGDGLSADTLLYDSQGATEQTQASTARITRLTPVDFAGHRWTLRFTQPGGLVTLAEYRSVWLVLFGGTMGSLLLFGLMLWRQQRILFYQDKAETAQVLRASELRYRRLFESAKDGILILDAETGMVVDVNPYLVELLGVTREAFLGKKVWELGFFKDAVANEANFAELKEKKYIRYEDMALEGHDGQRHEVEFVSNIYLVNHQQVIQCNIHDITERKQAEEELSAMTFRQEAILAAVPDIIMEVDNSRIYTWANKAGHDFFGDDVIGKEANFYFEGDQSTYHDVQSLFDGDENIFYVESLQRRKDGEKRLLSWWCKMLKDPTGRVSGALSSCRDITERKRAEEEVHKLNAELEQRVRDRTTQLEATNKELEAFSYSVSHDLRAPLRHVQGYVDMLAQEAGGRFSDKGRHYMQTIVDASQEMGELIDDLLAFSRMGRVEMMETSVDLNALVQDALRDLEETAPGRNIVWKIPPLPAVQADPAMLKRVLANLLGNAVKFTRPRDPAVIEMGIVNAESGSQRSEVRDQKTGVYEEGEGQKAPFTTNRSLITDDRSPITLFVRDNGVGFDPQYAHKLFGIFQRLHRADEFEGTGIGLANVRRIIARHGGRTWAEGAVDKGAAFYFTLKPSKTTQPTN